MPLSSRRKQLQMNSKFFYRAFSSGGDQASSVADGIKSPSGKVASLVEKILELDMLEVNQLVYRIQNRLGITGTAMDAYRSGGFQLPRGSGGGVANAGAGGGGGAAAAAASAAPKEKEVFDVKLGAVDAKAKIKIIKEVRAITGLGLKEVRYFPPLSFF